MPTKHDIQDVECLHYYDDEISSCGCGFIGFKKSQVFDYNFGDDDDDGDSEELFEINLKKESRLDSIREEEWCESSTVFSLDIHNDNNLDDVVYVAVGTNGGSSSMEALSWTLKHAVTPSTTTVSLLHVFPQVKLIPTPLGKIPRSHVNLEHVNIHLTQVKSKLRKLLLQKFMKLCIESKVKVEMMLIEGDNVAEAIVDLVGNLNIRKLVIGTTHSNLSKKGPGRQNSIADMVLKSVQESCDVKIICEGKEVIDQMINGSTSKSKHTRDSSSSRISHQVEESHGFVPLKLLMPNLSWLFRSRFLSPR